MGEEPRRAVGLIEDSDVDHELFARVFDPTWEVRRWNSGESALRDFSGEDDPLAALSVLVIDLHLTGIDGLEVAERVRTMPGGKHLPLCLLTSSRLDSDRRRGLDVGVDAFLVKPNNTERLRELPGLVARLVDER